MGGANNSAELLQQLKRILEQDKVFLGPEFLSYYARVVFGKKREIHLTKNATILAKEFKAFIENINIKQEETGVIIFSLDPIERQICKAINRCVALNAKVVDGDVMLDKFHTAVAKDSSLQTEEAQATIRKYAVQEELTMDVLSAIEERFVQRRCMYNTIKQYQILYNFVNNGYKEVKTWDEYLDSFNTVLQQSLKETKSYSMERKCTVKMSDESMADIITKEARRERISTRYRSFDWAMNGGFEKGRIYMLGGISGGGKSLVLVNMAYMSMISLAEKQKTVPAEERKKKAVLYITLENSAEETKMRFVCCALGTPKKILEGAGLSGNINQYDEVFDKCFRRNDVDLFIVWHPAKSINTLDLMTEISDLERSNDVKFDIILVDYADKMAAINPSKADQEWRDLGSVVDELKALAVEYDVPVITVTQVTTSSYKKDAPLDGSSVAGSRRKYENVDFVGLFNFAEREMVVIDGITTKVEDLEKMMGEDNVAGRWVEVWIIIDKNRDGPSHVKMRVFIDYATYRLIDDKDRVEMVFGKDSMAKTETSIFGKTDKSLFL